MIYTTIELILLKKSFIYLKAMPIFIWILCLPIWPIVIIVINESIKMFEIK